jgi:hypothetical protein
VALLRGDQDDVRGAQGAGDIGGRRGVGGALRVDQVT